MKIGKYEFQSKEEAKEIIDVLGENNQNTIVELGYIVIEQGTYDENFEELTPPIYSDKYSVDVLWQQEEEESFLAFKIDLNNEGLHSFMGLKYEELK